MRVVVVGGTRFIGPFVVRALVERGHQVTVFHRGQTEGDLPPEVRHAHSERSDLAALAAALRPAPDVVLDTCAFSEHDATTLARATRGAAGRLVVLSSIDVYLAYGRLHGTEPGPVEPVPLTENSPLRERPYPYRGAGRGLDDYEKILVERAVMEDPKLPATVLRLPVVYGPGDQQRRIAFELKRMDDRRPAILLEEGLARWRWSRGYVENVATVVALAATDRRTAGHVYNVAEWAPTTDEWVRAIGRAAGWRGEVVIVPKTRWPQAWAIRENTEQHLVADSSRIREEVWYREPVALEEGLRRTVEWERLHRPPGLAKVLDYEGEDRLLAELAAGGLRPAT